MIGATSHNSVSVPVVGLWMCVVRWVGTGVERTGEKNYALLLEQESGFSESALVSRLGLGEPLRLMQAVF